MLTALFLVGSAFAGGEWDLKHQLAVTWFGQGLRYAFTAEDRFPIWKREGVLFDDTFVAVGAYGDITPAYVRAGPRFHVVPVAVLDIEADVLFSGYFGTFSGVTDFSSPQSDYSEAAFATPELDARAHAGVGVRARVSPTLQAKVGRFIIALPNDFYYQWQQRPAGTGDYWYEPQLDALLRWSDFAMVNSGMSFWAFREATDEDKRMVWLGVRFDHQYIFGTADRQLKLGPILVFKPAKPWYVPTVVCFAQAWLAAGGAPPAHPVLPPYLAAALIW